MHSYLFYKHPELFPGFLLYLYFTISAKGISNFIPFCLYLLLVEFPVLVLYKQYYYLLNACFYDIHLFHTLCFIMGASTAIIIYVMFYSQRRFFPLLLQDDWYL